MSVIKESDEDDVEGADYLLLKLNVMECLVWRS